MKYTAQQGTACRKGEYDDKRTDTRSHIPRRGIGELNKRRFAGGTGLAGHAEGTQGKLCRYGGKYDRCTQADHCI